MLFIFTNDGSEAWYEGAWQSLYANNYDKVYKIALKIVIDRELAKDVTQEAFTNAFLKIGTLRDKEKFNFWICSIAENIAKNMLKKKINCNSRNVPFDDMDADVSKNVYQLQESNSPEALYAANEEAKEVLNCIEELDFEEQRILHMKFYEDYTYAQIAEQMNLKEGTIRMKALRAREKILSKLKMHDKKKDFNLKGSGEL